MSLSIPTIHLNGTSKDALEEALTTAHTAVFNAIGALQETAPNGRDYYPQGSAATSKAISEHQARINALLGVQEQLLQIIIGIQNQD